MRWAGWMRGERRTCKGVVKEEGVNEREKRMQAGDEVGDLGKR